MEVEVIPGEFASADPRTTAMRQVAYGLMAGRTAEEAAQLGGVCRATVFNWKRDPQFREIMQAAQAQVLQDARTRLVTLTTEAAETVAALMKDASVKGAPTQLAAAIAVFDRAGVEITATQAEGVRRIVSRLPEKQAAQVIAPTPPVAEAQSPPATAQRQPIQIVRGGVR